MVEQQDDIPQLFNSYRAISYGSIRCKYVYTLHGEFMNFAGTTPYVSVYSF